MFKGGKSSSGQKPVSFFFNREGDRLYMTWVATKRR